MTRTGLVSAAVSLAAVVCVMPGPARAGENAAEGNAVAASSFQAEAFGGGDESGGMYGGGVSLTLPLGSSLGLQVDGVGGKAASETSFYGGAAQLFFRQPDSHLIGVAVSALSVDDASQFGISAIGEYYLDQITLEALAGIQTGDIVDGGFGGRIGFAYYASPNLRVGGGLSYTEASELGGDLNVEYLVAPGSGLALYAMGGFDNGGALGLVGLRLYGGAPDQAPAAADGEAAEGPSLIYRHRNMGRPNSFVASPGTGLRLVANAAGAMKHGTAFGEIEAMPVPAAGGGVFSNSVDGGADNPASALTDFLGRLVSAEGEQAPLGNLLAGILPAGSTGTPLDGIPIVGDLLGSVAELLSPETLRIRDLPTGANSLAALPLVGDILGLLPAEPVLYLLGAAKPEQLLGGLVPSILQGLGDPAVLQGLLGRVGDTVTNLLSGGGAGAGLPLAAFIP